jgi:hypothetical protein
MMRQKCFPLISWLLLILATTAFFYIQQKLTTCADIKHFRTESSHLISQWDDLAIALKTGSEVALQRVPIQLVTFLADVKNKIMIGNGPNITVGDIEVIDVYTNLYNETHSSIGKSMIFTY